VLRLPNVISGGSEKLGPSLDDSCQCSKKARSERCISLLKLYQAAYRSLLGEFAYFKSLAHELLVTRYIS
jgi:hypothetical protein